MRKALIASVVVLATAMAGCGGGSKSSSKASKDDGTWKPTTVQEQLLSQTTADGVLPKDAALQLFVAQYGPLPGVTPLTGDLGAPGEGTLAIVSVSRYWDELTEAQRSKIGELIGRPGYDPRKTTITTASGAPGSTAGGPGRSRRADAASAAAYVASANAVMPYLERHFGPLGVPLEITSSTACNRVPRTHTCALADALVWDGKCDINVYPAQFPAPSGPSITLAHELFHCYQQVWNGGVLSAARNWVQEGGAEWVGMTINIEAGGPEDSTLRSNFIEYYATPTRPLFSRVYDAVGFFALAQQSGVDVMERMRAVVVGGGNRASFDALGLPLGESFSSDWATTQRSEASWGARWTLRGPGVPTITRTLPVTYRAVGNGNSFSLNSPAFATAQGGVNLRADLTRVTSSPPSAGYTHVSTQERSLASLRNDLWCTNEDFTRCRCPEGTRQAGRTFPQLTPGETMVVVGAGVEAGSVQIQGVSLEDECGREPKCPVGTWKMESAATGLPFTLTSGGYGKILTIREDGSFVQSFAEFVTATGELRDATFSISATGQITGQIEIPANTLRPTGMRVLSAEASGLGGSERITFSDGNTIEITGPEFAAIASTFGAGGSGTLNCQSNTTLTATAGAITETYTLR